ncbi:uncharacterized protein LOC135111519 isoform X2 [Scylla paramamosain]|uniref:uncharacterized protein LOC135111519 isoform X2 n=1 Tax=Scylla paramamosain TaxID=85552 RepID=UPI003082F794
MDHAGLSAEFQGFPQMHNVSRQTDEDLQDAGASEIAKMSPGVATFIAVLFIGYLVLGLTGNFLTILALLRCPRVRNVTAAFIISLCVADFLFCILVLPWEVSRFLAGKWIWGEGWICTLFPLLRYWNVAVSLLSIAMITINRYIMIAHFSVYKLVYRKGWIALMIAFCWVFAFVMLLPTLLSKWGRFGFDQRLQTCSIIDEENKSPKQVLFGLGFCVPAIIIIICYSLIFYVIHKSEKRMRQHSSRSVNGAHHGPSLQPQPRLAGKMEREVRRRRNEWRITKMVLIIFIAFLITYLPITLVKNLDKKVDYPGLHVLGYVLIYVSSCINPVIYVIMNRQYRQAYKTVLLCKRPRLPSLTSSHTEMDKNAHCHRYESIMCHSCMSQAHPPPSQPSPSSDHPHTSLHFLHLVNSFKKSFDYCLLEIVAFINLFNTAQAKSSSPDSCKKCKRLRATHKFSCVDCQTKMNTKRNTVLGLEVLADANRSKGAPEEVECSQAFVDHLLHLDSPQLTHNKREEGAKKVPLTRKTGTNTPEFLQVTKIPHSQSLAALKLATEMKPVGIRQRPHSDGSYSTADPMKCFQATRCPQAWCQITQSTIALTTALRGTENDSPASLTTSSQSHVPQQSLRTSVGGDSDSGHTGAFIDNSSKLEITSNSSEIHLDPKSTSASLSSLFFSFPSASHCSSKNQSDRPLEHKQSYFFSSPYPRVPNLTHSTSFPSHAGIEEGSRGVSSKHTEIDQHGYENPSYQD